MTTDADILHQTRRLADARAQRDELFAAILEARTNLNHMERREVAASALVAEEDRRLGEMLDQTVMRRVG
jgi:hypothetical protein